MVRKRLSGLQKDVLALYRRCLRAAISKGDEQAKVSAVGFVTQEFRKNVSFARLQPTHVSVAFHAQATTVKRSDVQRIEYLIRKGVKQLETFSAADVSGFGGTHTASVPEASQKYFEPGQPR